MAAELTGRKVLAICVAFFGTVIAVNLVLAFKAVETFPGLEVENSYVASQSFDKDLTAQKALGWTLDYQYSDGQMVLAFRDKAGKPLAVGGLNVLVGRVTEAAQDQTPVFSFVNGVYTAPVTLADGRWMIMVQAQAGDGTHFHQRLSLEVRS